MSAGPLSSKEIFCFFDVNVFLLIWNLTISYRAGTYLFKVNNENTRTLYGNCSKLTIKTKMFLLLTLDICQTLFSLVDFGQVNADWLIPLFYTWNKLCNLWVCINTTVYVSTLQCKYRHYSVCVNTTV